MNSLDQQVVEQLSDWLEAGKQCWLCTIINTFGSSPRPVGSLLACNEDGLYCGSLSGGCVEDDLRESINKRELATSKPEKITYGVTVEDVQRLGLPCGGTLEVVIEPIEPAYKELYRTLADKISARELVTRRVNIETGETTLVPASTYQTLTIEEGVLYHTYGPSFQLLLIGAVQVAYYLANMAPALDYQVEICDPRAELVENSPITNVPVINAMPDDWLRSKTLDQQTAIIALCHDPRIDDMALMEALQDSQAFYIGAMGSERTSAQRRERLTLLDIAQDEIDKLHAPVGLSIGSKTPPEIAIAILAELTSLRAMTRKKSQAMTSQPVTAADIGMIVLAAGSSRRFGADKRLASIDGSRTLLEKTLASIPASFTRKILVLKKDDSALAQQFSKEWEICIAEAPEAGMANSLASAIAQAQEWQGALIALGDMPYIAEHTFTLLQQTLLNNDIVIPVYDGHWGNPAGFRKKYFPEIKRLQGDKGARTLLKKYHGEGVELEIADEGILRDIDRPDMLR